MKKWNRLLWMVGLIIVVGCDGNVEMGSVLSSGQTDGETKAEQASTKDLDTAFLDYMGKDELAHVRSLYTSADGEEGELKEGKMIEAETLKNEWGTGTIPYEDMLQSIDVYLEQEGFENISADIVAEYMHEIYRQGPFSDNIYDDIYNIASHINESSREERPFATGDTWKVWNQTNKNFLAAQMLNFSPLYEERLSNFDMENVPPELLAAYVDKYLQVYEQFDHPNVVFYLENALSDMMVSDEIVQTTLDHVATAFNTKDTASLDLLFPERLNPELFDYASFDMDFELVEIIRLDPLFDTFYGVADMSYSYTTNQENLKNYEEEHGESYPKEKLFNAGEDVYNKKARTLVVIKKEENSNFGFTVRSIYELDKKSQYASEFIE